MSRRPESPHVRLAFALGLLLSATGVLGCVPDLAEPDFRWPDVWEELPACDSPWPGEFQTPTTIPASGLLFMNSSGMQPIGHPLHLRMEIRQIGGAPDLDDPGPITLTATPSSAFELLAIGEPIGGEVVVEYRLTQPGSVLLDADVGDGRTGHTELYGYQSNLGIWELNTTQTDMTTLLAAPIDSRLRIPASLTVDGETYAVSTRLHGGSSAGFTKKSWRIDLEPDADGDSIELPDGTDHLILRAEWADKTMLRNALSFALFRNGTTLPASQIEPVHLRINGEFYGLMQRAERIDGDFLNARGLSNDSQLYESDAPREAPPPGGNLTPLNTEDDYRTVYQQHRGREEYTDLIDLIERVLPVSGAWRTVPVVDEIAVEDVLVYVAVQGLIQNQDHFRKNFYLSRIPYSVNEDRWRFFPWDMDISWGHLWTEQFDILDEQLFLETAFELGDAPDPTAWNHNALIYAVLAEREYQDGLHEAMLHLLNDVFTTEFVQDFIDNMLCRTTPELLADTRKRADNDEYLILVDELSEFLEFKRDAAFGEVAEPARPN